jgi:phage terminase large subunit
LKRILTTKARLIVIIGGRSSAKSESVGRVLLMKNQTEGADVLCGREYQNSIDDSVHKLLKGLIKKLKVTGYETTDKKINCLTGGEIKFRGFARNSDAVKSAQDFKYSWIEEAQSLSQKSIDDLLPTIRSEGSQLFFTANPQSSADPFSKRFIVPFIREIKLNGFYEDDMHLIIEANWRDNPWHGELESQRMWDYNNLPRAKYDHIWEGAFNDSIEDPLILAEWFDSCIDAHKKLGFDPVGVRLSSHDPSDVGPDNKGFAFRHGSVVQDVQEKIDGDINEGGDWALSLAINHNSDGFNWDCDGMGVGLNAQITKSFEGKHTTLTQFKGSEGVDFPDAIFDPADGSPVREQKTNKDALRNKRAQYYFILRNRIYKTHQAVNGKYINPDELLSFSSDIECLTELRSELCRMPIKYNSNGKFELYTKQEMKTKFKFNSPNLADSVMMLMKTPALQNNINFKMPQPMKPMGRTGRR